jgi:hypothetical protein
MTTFWSYFAWCEQWYRAPKGILSWALVVIVRIFLNGTNFVIVIPYEFVRTESP